VPPFYVTTPIYYVNDVPHIGHAYATVTADALARWHRLAGDEVFFLTGTDEHGDKIARAAEANGVSPQEWVDRTSARFVEAWALLNISNDDFIRTTEPRHHRAVQHFLQTIHDNGYTELGVYQGLYCVYCEDYKKESDLVDGLRHPSRPVEVLEEENYFFKLSAFGDRLLQWYEDHPDAIQPDRPSATKRWASSRPAWRTSPSHGRRRSGAWKFPGTRSHVFYVWYDALINYLTAIGYGEDRAFRQVVARCAPRAGKDIIRFHCVWWPAMCMAAGIEPPAHFLVTGGFSCRARRCRSRGATRSHRPTWWPSTGSTPSGTTCCATRPWEATATSPIEGVTARYNADLANNLGNLMARVSTVVGSKCGGDRTGP
jgi:methionyl-tRNA synthetase